MPNTIAEIIKEESDKLRKRCGSTDSSKSLVDQAKDLFLRDTPTQELRRFGNNFIITSALSSKPHLNLKFNHYLAESLLREGSLLLDRCLQQRRQYQELQTKWFEACIQVDELIRLSEITEKEEKENYDIPSEIAQSELGALLAESDQIKEVLRVVKELLTKIDDTQTKIGTYQWELAGQAGKITDWKALEGQRGFKESIPIRIQEAQENGLQKSNNERAKGAAQNVALKKSLAGFQRERNDVARFVALRRARELTRDGGALDFLGQMAPIWDRLQNDLAAAWFRLIAAAKGFQDLYQYPIESFMKDSPKGGINFDELVTWCQNTNTWLASFVDTQQQVTRSFSLRQLAGEARLNFDASISSGKCRFRLSDKHFQNKQFVRMRSFAVQIDSGHTVGNWNIAIAPPTKGLIRQNGGEVAKLDQGHIGTLYLGRVNERTYAVVPESSAPPKLYNASPIGDGSLSGDWGIEILGSSTSGIPTSAIQDIDIHLTVALV